MINRILFLWIFICPITYAQKWDMLDKDYSASIVSIEIKMDHNIYGYGTGAIIEQVDAGDGLFKTKILTASHNSGYHMFPKTIKKYKVRSANGLSTDANVVYSGEYHNLAIDEERDVMVLETKMMKMTCLNIAEKPPAKEEFITVVGLGGQNDCTPNKENIRVFKAKRCIPDEFFVCDAYCIHGDSGGPMLYNDEIISVVSGGFVTIKKGAYTWPVSGVNLGRIKEALNIYKVQK